MNRIDKLIENAIEDNLIPGANILVSKNGQTIYRNNFGYRSIDPNKQRMKENTVFDIASLTKVVATLPSILKLIDLNEITLNSPVVKYLPTYIYKDTTIQSLLTHTSGLPAHKPYFLTNSNRDDIIQNLLKEERISQLNEKVIYSDLNYILLSLIIEKVSDMNLNNFAGKFIFEPLNMKQTTFLPQLAKECFAATEFDSRKNQFKVGEVHDENAEALGGISGHAGLFSTIEDLSTFCNMVENEGAYNGTRVLSSKILRESRRDLTKFSDQSRGLGWQLNRNLDLQCGPAFSEYTYGHTGFTGTSLFFEPTQSLFVILLTNRVHLGREKSISQLRRDIHSEIINYLK
ncbi:serine hydrolase domain-containing protein [Piscibacillus sp. B03]|uniref:serine hydrolase domain-containing protein n=1 Tax=Piscibacillus sp. B03 TaxID=3457430 RepID=UPI003FCEC348